MATLTYHDDAGEFRIEIVGYFSGIHVHELEWRWRLALAEFSPQKVTVDISRLAAYGTDGCKLLQRMYKHGAKIAAANPNSLIFLDEITATPRREPASALVRESVRNPYPATQSEPLKAAAAGRG